MYENYQSIAFPGMKADSGDDRVESFPVGAAGLGLGLVSGTDANGLLVAGPGTKLRGLSLHSHTVTGAGYVEGDCASILTRGFSWVLVTSAGAVTDGGSVKFAADGTVANAGANTLPNAVFRSGKITAYGMDIALVELHNPFSETDTLPEAP